MIERLKDKLLILKIRGGQTDAFAEIFNQYAPQIYRFIFFKVGNQEETEDLTSEIFLKLWQYISQTEKELYNLKAFIYQMARNQVIDYYRTRATKETVSFEQFVYQEEGRKFISGQQLRIFQEMDFAEEFKEIKSALDQLKEEYREVLLLKYVEEFSTAEIAQIIEKSKGATRVIIHRALGALKEIINQQNQQNEKPRINS